MNSNPPKNPPKNKKLSPIKNKDPSNNNINLVKIPTLILNRNNPLLHTSNRKKNLLYSNISSINKNSLNKDTDNKINMKLESLLQDIRENRIENKKNMDNKYKKISDDLDNKDKKGGPIITSSSNKNITDIVKKYNSIYERIFEDLKDNNKYISPNPLMNIPIYTSKSSLEKRNVSTSTNNFKYEHNPFFKIKPYKNTIPPPPPKPIIKKKVNIEVTIDSLQDLIDLIDKHPIKVDIEYNINMKSIHNIKEPLEELNNMIGMNKLKNSIVDQILYFVQGLHTIKSKKSQDFMHTVIYGPPGTGKTEVAKIMGRIFSKLGILKKNKFCKATRADLIAGYLGQTALKTRDMIKDCLGGVLFIDEAYALGNPEKRDSFAKECIDTLCEALSDHKDELMVIIAGYEHDLKRCFFSYNQGLDSRFTWRFNTDDYKADELREIFMKKVKDAGWSIDKENEIPVSWFEENMEYFKYYGRDMETLFSKTKIAHSRRVFCLPKEKKTIVNMKDVEKGLEMYLDNDEVKDRKEKFLIKKEIYQSMYN